MVPLKYKKECTGVVIFFVQRCIFIFMLCVGITVWGARNIFCLKFGAVRTDRYFYIFCRK